MASDPRLDDPLISFGDDDIDVLAYLYGGLTGLFSAGVIQRYLPEAGLTSEALVLLGGSGLIAALLLEFGRGRWW